MQQHLVGKHSDARLSAGFFSIYLNVLRLKIIVLIPTNQYQLTKKIYNLQPMEISNLQLA